MESAQTDQPKRTYTWPRYLLAAVILGIALSVFAVVKEMRRVQSFERFPIYSPDSSQTATNG